ncbi:MAG: response regulator transcription factor [Burkholderiaceae bacterium]
MKVLLVDDHPSFRDGLSLLLSELSDEIEFLHAGSVADVTAHSRAQELVDLILVDLGLADSNGLDSLRQIRDLFAESTVVVLSGQDSDPDLVEQCLESGAAGFVPKSSSSPVLIGALQLVLAGGVYLPAQVLRGATRRMPGAGTAEGANPALELSQRHIDTLMLVIQGKPNKVVARELNISEGTVKQHLSVAYRALGVNNRTEAAFAAADLGLVPGRRDK